MQIQWPFSQGPDFTLKLPLERWSPLRGPRTKQTPIAGVKSHSGAVPGLHAKRCGTHVNYRGASPLAMSRNLKVRSRGKTGHVLHFLVNAGGIGWFLRFTRWRNGTWLATVHWRLYHTEFEQSFISRQWTEAHFFSRVLFRTVPLTIKPIKMIQKFCSSVRLHILSFANPISFKSHADKRHLRLHGSSYTAPIMLAKKDMRGNGKTAEFCPYYSPQT